MENLKDKILIPIFIIAAAVLIALVIFSWLPEDTKKESTFGTSVDDIRLHCTASSTYFRLAANATTQILGTSTSQRVWAKAEATSTPGATMFAYVAKTTFSVPTGFDLEGPMIPNASSTVELVKPQDVFHDGKIYAQSKESVAGIMVTECLLP